MTGFFLEAGQAIGRTVAEWYPENAINWGNIVPGDDWGMSTELWDQMLQEVCSEFEALIAPCTIKDPGQFLELLNEPLNVLQAKLDLSAVCPGQVGSNE